MKETIEQAAKRYASSEIEEGGLCGLNGIDASKYQPFIDGAEWQVKQSPWIKVEEQLPTSDNNLYIALDTKMNPFGCDVCDFDLQSKKWTDSKGYIVFPTHWMPIPD